jgi:hypothetical protein
MGVSPQTQTIQNPDGSTTTVAVTWDPAPPPPPPLLIGNASGKPDLIRYPGTSVCTVFFQPNKGFNAAAVAAIPADVYVIACVKDTYDMPGVAQGIADTAATGRKFGVVHHHEPEAEMPAAQFLAESAPFAKACAGWDDVDFGIKLLRFSLLKPGADFRQWVPEGIDWAGVDCYDQTGTVEAEDLAEIAVELSGFAGVPGALTEYMWLRGTGDTTGAVRAGRIADAAAIAGKAGFRFALPWDALGSKTAKYPLGIPFGPFPLNSPEYGATRALITAQ